MKKIYKKKSANLDFYKIFKPELTPKKMLELGVFGGSYFGSKIKEYPSSWLTNAKLSNNFDVSLILRKGRVDPVHKINIPKIKISSNIISFIFRTKFI